MEKYFETIAQVLEKMDKVKDVNYYVNINVNKDVSVSSYGYISLVDLIVQQNVDVMH